MHPGRLPILVTEVDCERAVAQAVGALNQAGFFTLRSFDLHSAVSGRVACSGQMVVLLVYAQEGSPATLIFDSQESFTGIYLVNGPAQSDREGLLRTLRGVFPPASLSNPGDLAA